MSKPTLWRECKLKSLTFDKPYQLLTCEDLSAALAKANEHNELIVTNSIRTPTEEEMKLESVHDSVIADSERDSRVRTNSELVSAVRSREVIERQLAIERSISERKANSAPKALEEQSPSTMDDLLTETREAEINGKPFRIQNQRFFLTYKTHIDKTLIAQFFEEKNIKECISAHECADDSSPYEHTHVYVDFGRNYQSTNARIFDLNSIHPNIKVIRSSKHLENIWAYLCKEDTSNEYLLERLTKPTLFDAVSKCKNIHEVMRMARTPNDAAGLATMYALREKETFEPKPLEHIWQQELLEELATTPNERKIVWYYDNVGNTGKSTFARYVQAKGLATVMSQLGGDRDSGQLIETARDSGWDGRAIIIDLLVKASTAASTPRSSPSKTASSLT